MFQWMMHAASFISGPYFAAYYKNDLGYDYVWYIIVAGTMMVAKDYYASAGGAFHSSTWCSLCDGPERNDDRSVALFWTLGREMPYILFLQIVGGVYWGRSSWRLF